MKHKTFKATLAAFAVLIWIGCNPKPEKISIGTDNCVECKMTIVDAKFGAEIVTKKGKVYKFDDAHCMAVFLERRGVELADIHQTLFVDYNDPNRFIKVRSVEFVVSSQFKTPMGGHAAAFRDETEARKKAAQIDGSKVTNWATLYNILIK